MLDRIRKIFILGLFCATVAGVWALGAAKAELDGPSSSAGYRVDPALVQAALNADPASDRAGVSAAGAELVFFFSS